MINSLKEIMIASNFANKIHYLDNKKISKMIVVMKILVMILKIKIMIVVVATAVMMKAHLKMLSDY